MKKFTFMLIATFFATIAFAQKPFAKAEEFARTTNETVQNIGIKTAPQGLSHKMMSAKSTRARAQKKATSAADLVGDYKWDYETSSQLSTDLESLETTTGSLRVKITLSEETEGGITISGMFSNDLEATVVSNGDDTYIGITQGQTAGTSSYGDYTIKGLYYEGDEEHDAGWYYGDIWAYLQEDGSIYFPDWICKVLTTGDYAGYNLTPYYVGGSTLTPTEPLSLVELPDGVEAEEYSMCYEDGDGASSAVTVHVAIDGSDVYVQGFSYYIPEAWVKGTRDGNIVTFPAMQYVGEYYGYSSFAFYEGDAVFTYDAEADTYTAEGEIYGVLGDKYYDGHYFNPVIKKVVEKAAMPAAPAITALENGSYGWYFMFNVPVVDVNGDALVTSKLAYMIYTNTNGEIAPLTFTPATHTKLTENMTEIPYGFTESYDFYDTYIYLNDLYSEDWDKIGIQSIYYGGGETNATEIQWFDIAKNELVVLPEGVEAEEYSMAYEDSDGNSAAKAVNVAIDGSDVYVQGFSDYIPKAWVKGTKDGNVVTFPAMQYVGEYSGYTSFFFYNGETVFTYNPEADTYTAEGEIYGVLGDKYYDGHYFNPVIKKVADKAAMPAAPEITNMENGSYGWYIDFNVPTVDVNGDGLAIGKLAYMIYTDTQGTIAPLTFTPDTHTKLTEDMTEIPYGFTENYDFYANTIYLNDLYSADWTRIGIQSIYYGGGETNATEIQWFDILPEPELVVVPEGLETEAYLFKANEYVENKIKDEEGNVISTEVTWEEYSFQTQVGFDGSDVYFKGVSDDTSDMWLKGTLSEDGKTVTIPANQYMGETSFWGYTFPYFFTAVAEDGETMEDIVLNYDAEASTFITDQVLVLHDGKRSLGEPYQTFKDVVITKMQEFSATPADPTIDSYKFEGSYPYINFVIPAEDVNGNALLTSKLFYIVWIEEGGEEKPFVVHADEYKYIDEDITEIPYDYDDSYDIYKGGSRFYINPTDACASWTKFGVQSIYYGGGERNVSNIVWSDGSTSESKDVVKAPKDLVTEFYTFDGFDLDYNANTVREVEVGFYGENEVYIQGLSEYLPDAWVKGTLESGILTIPETYLGTYTVTDGDWSESYALYFSGSTFSYDAVAGTFYSEWGYVTCETSEYFYDQFRYVTLTKLEDYATTPADPEILEFSYLDNSYPYVKFNIPTVNCIDGGKLIKGKLYYQLYYYKDLEVTPLVLTTSLYPELDADMSEIPYQFSQQSIVFNNYLYLRQSDQEIDSWYQIGLQSIYYGGGERRTSEIVWFVNPTPDGIDEVNGEWSMVNGQSIYNISGQRIAKAQKGINIVMQGSAKANGKKVLIK